MYDSATIAALQAGQLVLRDFLTIHGKDSGGDPVDFCFWTGEDDVVTNVVDARDGSTDSRNFIGGGTLLDVPPIVDAIGMEARSIEFGLSQIHAEVQDMVRGNNIRVAVVELHRGVYDPTTWALVSTPFPRFLGRVDGVSIDTAAVGGEGGIRLTAVGDSIDLTRTNPALKSDETQRLRSDDRFRRYSDSAGDVEVWWGQARGTA
ncbi:MAG: hypothetical protein ABI216_00620 [Devosia sp.]